MKDPAFLFYSSDFLTKTLDLTMEERGQYITLLCLQHQKGHLDEKTIRLCLGSVSQDVLKKFTKDKDGKLYDKDLEDVINKRSLFVESRRQNGCLGGRPRKPTENLVVNGSLGVAKPRKNLGENVIENINIIINIINYLNNKLNTKYIYNSKKTVELINARLKEGFTEENFKTVIDKKSEEWLNDPKMAQFLRPETLFSNKFESYLNQKVVRKDKFSNPFLNILDEQAEGSENIL